MLRKFKIHVTKNVTYCQTDTWFVKLNNIQKIYIVYCPILEQNIGQCLNEVVPTI